MRNLILTICLTFIVSLAYSQIHVVAPNGDVGIGTTSPEAKLDVDGYAVIRGNKTIVGSGAGGGWATLKVGENRTGNGYSVLDLHAMTGTDYGARLVTNKWGATALVHRGANKFFIRTDHPDSPICFRTAGNTTNRVVIATDGRVGIGFDTPGYKLAVNGWAGRTGSSDWEVISDRNLKKDITEYDMGLAEILNINPVYFKYNGKAGIEDTETTYVGLIAQDFQKVAPYAVKELKYTETIREEVKSDKIGKTIDYLSMDGTSIRYMLVNAVKEQQQSIEKQQNIIDKQHTTIEEQNKAITTLQTELADLSQSVKNLQNNSNNISSTIKGTGKAYLEQNTPNPLQDYTRIEYFIPVKSTKAFLTVQTLAGQLIQRIDITEKGKGFIELKLKELPAGVYSYRLKIDGNTVDTKKMIVE